MAKRPKLAIIDSHALIHRAYYALPPMNAPDGTPTNAAYGYTTMLLKMIETVKPTHVVAAFDMKGPTFRHEEYKEYKAQRKQLDDELIAQFDVVREIVKAFGIPILEKQGFEADDVIGTVVTQAGEHDIDTVVVTGDMDTLQLVDDDTKVFTLRKGMSDTILYDENLVREKYGFGPEHVTDYKGLAGDSSDNIPGVAGIGDKSARDLVVQYGSIENIFEHIDELSTRVKNRLDGKKDEALFSRKLATIRTDAPVEFDIETAKLSEDRGREVEDILLKLGMKSLLGRLPKLFQKNPQPSLLVELRPASTRPDAMPDNYFLVQGDAEKEALKKKIKAAKFIAFDTETDGLGARTSPLIGVSMALDGEAYYIPVDKNSIGEWRDILESEKIGKTGHNLKYDAEVLRVAGVELRGIVFDTMIASYLLQPGSRSHKLDDVALEELGYRCIPITDLIGSGKDQISMRDVPLEKLAHYAAEDADVSLRLYEKLAPRIKEEGLARVIQEIELPLIDVLVNLELGGVAVDRGVLEDLRARVAGLITRRKKKIWELAGEEFNINSTQQLRVILYERLGLPTQDIKRTQSGYSTAASELKKLRSEHEIIGLLEEYRELTKLKSTYLDTLPNMIDEKTGRIYSQYNQVVAATGRLSSQDPNLQNIPIRTELGEEVRTAFVASQGKRLVKADYSQLELRLAAHIAQDEKMIAAFRAGEDIHRATAAWVLGVDQDSVTDEQRRLAKTLNFGVLYGMGARSFAQQAGVSFEEARSFIGRYRDQYVGIARLLESTTEQAETLGYVETLFGRKRYVPEIHSRTPGVRAAAERVAFNHPMQGTESDILKLAMVGVQRQIESRFQGALLVLSVHDELVCEVPVGDVSDFAEMMQSEMQGVITLDVPLIVDIGVGKNWRDTLPL